MFLLQLALPECNGLVFHTLNGNDFDQGSLIQLGFFPGSKLFEISDRSLILEVNFKILQG
jgi:hypothetical protein